MVANNDDVIEVTNSETTKTVPEVNIDEVDTDDVENAREREIKIVEETGTRDYAIPIIGILVILGFFITTLTLLYNKLPNENVGIGLYVLGVLSSAFSTVIGYYFGSSLGSKHKDNIIKTLKK